MNYYYHKADHRLSDYVQTILVIDKCAPQKHSEVPFYTHGMAAMLYKADHQTTLYGQSVPSQEWDSWDETTWIVFFFKPFALATIFNISAKELQEKSFTLADWQSKKAKALNIQLSHAHSASEKIAILSSFVHAQIQANQRNCDLIRLSTDYILQHSGTETSTQILQELNLTERTFQRLFKKYVGISLAAYRKICQYYVAFTHLKSGRFEKLSDIAYKNGYFDQSHFIRTFKGFSHITPKEYLQSGLE